MFKYLLIIVICVSAGYSYGWKDAKKHKQSVVERVVARVGGKNRGAYNTDLDARAEAAARQ